METESLRDRKRDANSEERKLAVEEDGRSRCVRDSQSGSHVERVDCSVNRYEKKTCQSFCPLVKLDHAEEFFQAEELHRLAPKLLQGRVQDRPVRRLLLPLTRMI
jgi:hypothetical protein